MNFSMRFIFETLLRTLRLVGLQACEQALSKKQDNLFLRQDKNAETAAENPEKSQQRSGQ